MNDDSLNESVFHALDTTTITNTDITTLQRQSKSFRASTATINYTYDEEPTMEPAEEMKRSASQESGDGEFDATTTIYKIHRKLLSLMSNPQQFHDAIDWIAKIEKGIDPFRPGGASEAEKEGLEFEKEDGTHNVRTSDTPSSAGDAKYPAQSRLIPPLPIQIFASDAEVVLPEAMTASQLFGIERATGIELEAAAGIVGLSALFLRWLALMPEGDHMNIIDPPGLTVMRIAGGRYRVTGSHRVVWRWMNKFSPASTFNVPQDSSPYEGHTQNEREENENKDTDFDFGDLVTMTIIDVFETDQEGKLLSYCPTFDNRAVHRTQEVVERVKKGASNLKERVDVVVKSPTGQKALKAASHFGMRKYTQAIHVGNLVKFRIEEEIQKRNKSPSETSLDAVAGTDVGDAQEMEDATDGKLDNASSAATPVLETISSEAEKMNNSGGATSKRSKNEYYFSDDSTAASSPQPNQQFV